MKLFPSIRTRQIDFIIIGAQKSGTSSLVYYLNQHDAIDMAREGEPHIFDDEDLFAKHISKTKIDKLYKKYFKDYHTAKKIGEKTPIYIYWESSIPRIWRYNPNIQIIAMLRNPIDRAFSHWNMEVNRNNEYKDFMECIKMEYERAKDSLPYQPRVSSYTDRGFYSQQIRRLMRFFYPEQLLFIKYEDYKKYHEKYVKKVFEFLGLHFDNSSIKKRTVHAREYNRKISREESQYLLQIFNNDINEVERLLAWDCSDWKTID